MCRASRVPDTPNSQRLEHCPVPGVASRPTPNSRRLRTLPCAGRRELPWWGGAPRGRRRQTGAAEVADGQGPLVDRGGRARHATRPEASTTASSATASARCTYCSTRTTDVPRAWNRATAANTSSTTSGARPSDGSSSRRTRRLGHEGAGQGEHALLTTRHRGGRLGAALGQPREELERGLDARREDGLGRARGEPEVLGHGERGERGAAFGQQVDAAAGDDLGRAAGQVHALEQHGAGPRPEVAGDRLQQGRLPRAVRAQDSEQAAPAEGQVDPVEHLARAVAGPQAPHLEERSLGHGAAVPR